MAGDREEGGGEGEDDLVLLIQSFETLRDDHKNLEERVASAKDGSAAHATRLQAQVDQLSATAGHAKSNPVVWLEMREIYGDLADYPQFADAFSCWLKLIWSDGVRAALKTY